MHQFDVQQSYRVNISTQNLLWCLLFVKYLKLKLLPQLMMYPLTKQHTHKNTVLWVKKFYSCWWQCFKTKPAIRGNYIKTCLKLQALSIDEHRHVAMAVFIAVGDRHAYTHMNSWGSLGMKDADFPWVSVSLDLRFLGIPAGWDWRIISPLSLLECVSDIVNFLTR